MKLVFKGATMDAPRHVPGAAVLVEIRGEAV